MSKYCEFSDCDAGPYTKDEARKHKWRYHSFPIPFVIGGHEYIMAQSDTRYACPLTGCEKELKKRDDMQKHVVTEHNGGVSIKVFDTRDAPMDEDHDVSPRVLVPATPSPQRIMPIVDDGSPVDSATVKLLPSVDYLKSNKALDALGAPSTEVRQAFLAFCSEANIYEKPECVKLPSPGGPPVQLISPPTAGHACIMTTDCTYSVKDLPTMQRHCRDKHRTGPLVDVKYRACLVQRIFTGVGNSYFEISNDLLSGARPRLKDRLKEMFLPGLEAALVVPADTERERTPLVRCMAWDTFMPETRMNPTQRRAAQEIKKQHTDQEHDGILSLLAETVDDHFHKAATILDGHPQKLSLSKILVHGENIPPRDAKSNKNYPHCITQFVRCMIRLRLDFPLNFSFSLSTEQTHLLDKLIMMLRNPDASRRSRMISYHNLAWSLVDADPMQCNASWGNPIQRAIWLKALRADGNFYEPRDFTPDLAKWKYLCNITALLEALLDKDSDTDSLHPDDFERIARVHEKVLSLGRPTTFNMIYEMQQYASSLAFNQTQEAKVFLREGIQDLMRDMTSRYRALTQSDNVVTKMPDQVKDDLTNATRGYSFMSEKPFFEKRHSLLLSWWSIKELLRRTLLIWEPAYHLLYITTHISSRGTQFIDHQISNADRHRNLFMQGAEMFLLTGYSKKTSITDRDSCTPGFVPKDLAFWVLELLGGGLRTAEAILAGVAYGKDAEHLYRTYLCVGDGKRISPERFSAYVQHMNYHYFDCPWGLRDFRQGTITMGREFISPNESYADADSILAESADHSTNTDHAHYGIVHGSVPRLSNNTIIQQRWVCNEWHIFLGLGPVSPQLPVRLRRAEIARGTQGVDLESISDQVVKTMTGVLTSFLNDNMKTLIQHAVSAGLQEHQKGNDPSEHSSSGSWVAPPMNLEFNFSDMFFEDDTESSLPPSSAPSVSGSISPDLPDVLLPDGGASFDVCANQRSGRNVTGHTHPHQQCLLHGDQTELPAVRKWNGKGRAVDENQSSPSAATARRKATTHAFDQPLSFTSLINSSKARAREKAIEHPPPFTLTGEPGPSRTIVNASKGTARDNLAPSVHAFDQPPSFASFIDHSTAHATAKPVESLFTPTSKPGPSRNVAYASKGKGREASITQPHSSVSSPSSSPSVVPMAYRKHHRLQHISETDDDEEAPRKLRRLRRPVPQLQTLRWRRSAFPAMTTSPASLFLIAVCLLHHHLPFRK
ncbi:hypothetical protein DFH29DRAFT_1004189 [Suillus ampliporus]|nr:hypothetical protein DFH29DRAFT_1004189 [Suillus ampliporus]